jgi:hypothetical protein
MFDKYMEDFEILDDYADDFLDNEPPAVQENQGSIHNAPSGHAMSRVERILAGEENASIGTLMTSNTLSPPNNTSTPSNNTPPTLIGPTSITGNPLGSSQSTIARSVATSMSIEQMETNIISLNNNMTTITTNMTSMTSFLHLIANRLDINAETISAIGTTGNQNEATSSNNEGGCNQK